MSTHFVPLVRAVNLRSIVSGVRTEQEDRAHRANSLFLTSPVSEPQLALIATVFGRLFAQGLRRIAFGLQRASFSRSTHISNQTFSNANAAGIHFPGIARIYCRRSRRKKAGVIPDHCLNVLLKADSER
jgi:hypothetical protein